MLKNFLKVALNSFRRNKLFGTINVLGLAVGLASVILIGLYVAAELSFEDGFTDADRIYRVSRDIYPVDDNEALSLATLSPPAAALLKEDFPQIEEVARLAGSRGLLGRRETDTSYFEDGLRFVDPSFFDLFNFEWVEGDPASALESTTSIIITESTARRYFGAERALGQSLWLENLAPMQITGVIADLPANTHLTGTAFLSLDGLFNVLGPTMRTNWNVNMTHTYVRVAPGTDMDNITGQFPAFLDRHQEENASRWTGLSAMPIRDIHLHSERQAELKAPGSFNSVLALIAISAGILLIACFNFMNLSTARSLLRGKEVGVRKAIGSLRGQLILQFLAESIGMTLLATVFAIMVVELVLPAFNGFTGKLLDFDILHDPSLQGMMLLLVLVVGVLAGSYPALYLSSFRPIQVLRSRMRSSRADLSLRNLLVILQFSISIGLVISTAVVITQTRYARNYDLGFNKEQIVVLGGSPSQGLSQNWESMKQELLRSPDVISVTASSIVPGAENLSSVEVRTQGSELPKEIPPMLVDYEFFESFDIDLLAGRYFSREFPNDLINTPQEDPEARTVNYVINATAARGFGWSPEEALGKQLDIVDQGFSSHGRIVGVVADSNFESVRFSVKPMLFILTPNVLWNNNSPVLQYGYVRISGRNVADTLAHIDRVWKEAVPAFPIARSFLDDSFEALYQDDARLGQLFSSFSALAILIACLGLFGLATFSTQRRIKEIGVRKVMGSSVWGIVWLLTNDFSKLVLASNLIAWPAAYLVMDRWLAQFAYRVDLTPVVFIGSGLIALCIAWVTVGSTAAKAAGQKPVLALRYE